MILPCPPGRNSRSVTANVSRRNSGAALRPGPLASLPDLGALAVLAILLLLIPGGVQGQTTLLFLRNGDRLAGKIESEDTNHIVITTPWAKELSVPTSEIARREILAPKPLTNGPAGPWLAGVHGPFPVRKPPTVRPKFWKAEVRLGADYLYGATEQQIYYGRLKLDYAKPYKAATNQFFRNYLDYSVDYGWTKIPASGTNAASTVLSANRMSGGDKADVDIGKQWYLYDQAQLGYDEVLKIRFQYDVGPGAGYHLFTQSNFLANVEAGCDYQAQYRTDNTSIEDFFGRLAEDLSWRISRNLKFSEKAELDPRVDGEEYRARAEATLSHTLWRNLSLNFSVLDLYDTVPAVGVPHNEFQVHSSLGITF